jgi:hypothetical protein
VQAGPKSTRTDELDSFDSSLANLGEVVFAALEAAGARSIAEIGAENGLFTEQLLAWAERTGASQVIAIDPAPQDRLLGLAEARPELELLIGTSHTVLPRLDLPDAVIIDGDHNYFTVSEELRLIGERASGADLPLLLLHDIGWPLGRRDSYHAPERIPAGQRQPLAVDAYLVPGDPGVAETGLYYKCTAVTEGGPRNGVLTAVEDFIAADPDLRLAIVPPFFGLGFVWHPDAPWADAVERALAPWDRNPLLERVEAKRVDHLVSEFLNLQRIDALRTQDYVARYRLVGRLLPIYDSRAFALATRISRLRRPGRPGLSRADLGALLDELASGDFDVDRLRRFPEPSPEDYQLRVDWSSAAEAARGNGQAVRPDVTSDAP